MEEQTPQAEPSIFQRVRARLAPEGVPADDRGRMVMDSLILHIHPSKVEVTSMQWTYT